MIGKQRETYTSHKQARPWSGARNFLPRTHNLNCSVEWHLVSEPQHSKESKGRNWSGEVRYGLGNATWDSLNNRHHARTLIPGSGYTVDGGCRKHPIYSVSNFPGAVCCNRCSISILLEFQTSLSLYIWLCINKRVWNVPRWSARLERPLS